MPTDPVFTTPMMQQYAALKEQYQDCLLFFRLGDFYELFMDDALIGSKVLNITLTGRPRGKDGRIPMAGVPFHSVDVYLAKLVKAGHKVAICEQVSEPDKNGIVDRQVVRIVTPGTVLDEKSLNHRENNYLMSLSFDSKRIGIAVADISTGEFKSSEIEYKDFDKTLEDLITIVHPTECILSEKDYNNPNILNFLKSHSVQNIYCFVPWETDIKVVSYIIKNQFKIFSLEIFNIDKDIHSQIATAALINYLKSTQMDRLGHITKISQLIQSDNMHLDRSTIYNLELLHSIRFQESQGTLINIIDQTQTALGARLLRQWITKPLINRQLIEDRHKAVYEYINDSQNRENIHEKLKQIFDIERTLARLSVGIGNARDLILLKNTLQNVLDIKDFNIKYKTTLFDKLNQAISSDLMAVIQLIQRTIKEDPSFDPKSGGIINSGVNYDLDELNLQVSKSKSWIENLEKKEKERSGISSLKIRFNQVFGFYIEISKSYINQVPDNYIRKQTLVNGERYITPELKEHEEIILTAEEKTNKIEYQIYIETLAQVLEFTSQIQKAANAIATIDCLLSFAQIAEKNNYVRPVLVDQNLIKINNSRHPVVEKLLQDEQFVPNEIFLDKDSQQLILLTGPNMAGKSVLMRQVAITMLMSQIGSFVPADSANICVVDKIFVRSGASDMIAGGLSTFMVEMVEAAQILANATSQSLIIMDEIGRGTSTYDGISIAWAIAEYIVTQNEKSPLTLFATHYHELQKLQNDFPEKIKNYHMAIEQNAGVPIFLHILKPGGAAHSFGLAVAKLAGVPSPVVKRAEELLKLLESKKTEVASPQISVSPIKEQLPLEFDSTDHLIVTELQNLDIHQITPLQALNKLSELKNKIKLMQYSSQEILLAD
jgi:DNA mismatch repair protein MutS